MKKLTFIILLGVFALNVSSQDTYLSDGIKKLATQIQQELTPNSNGGVAFLGFHMKDKNLQNKMTLNANFLLHEALMELNYSLIDQIIVDAMVKEKPWKAESLYEMDFMNAYEKRLFIKNDMDIAGYMYGLISEENESIILKVYLLSEGMEFSPQGSTYVAVYPVNHTVKTTQASTETTNKNDNTDNSSSFNITPYTKPVDKTVPAPVAVAEPTVNATEKSVEKPVEKAKVAETKSEAPVYRGGADPLKGLNVSEEKKALQVGTYYALFIGIDNYSGDWPKLKNAVGDAKAIEALLKTKYKIDVFRSLFNEQATRENIINEFEWLMQNVKANDNVLIYYSGHGDFKQDLNKGYWVPFNATTQSTTNYISNNDIQTYLGGIKSKHTLLISDACFSGDIFRGKTVSIPFEESERYYSKVYNLVSRKAITSGGLEPVMDGGKEGHSVFAYYLLKSLSTNNSNFYDANQLFDAVKIPVINNSQQTPDFKPIKDTGDEGGQFIFMKK
jgi:hypothetical protein